MPLLFFCIVIVFFEVYIWLGMGLGLMGPETYVELGEKKNQGWQKSGGCQKATMIWCVCWP